MAKRRAAALGRGGSKRQRVEEGEEDAHGEDIFWDGDRGRDESDDDEGDERERLETAEEKRLRLAKSYLDQVRSEVEKEGEAEGEEEGGRDGEALREAVAAKLRESTEMARQVTRRKIASSISLPKDGIQDGGTLHRGHNMPITALTVTADDKTAYTVCKGGQIVQWDLERQCRTSVWHLPTSAANAKAGDAIRRAPWMGKRNRQVSKKSFTAAAVSSDGHYLAVGAGDMQIHVWDIRKNEYLKAFPGHRDVITGLVFQEGTHTLYSCSHDRTVKSWSLDDLGYLDTLFGHQEPVLAIDMLKEDRVLTGGFDRTCRVWKISEESQLIFRAPSMAVDCCRSIGGTMWVSGSADGLQLWSQHKKKPMAVVQDAHEGSGTRGAGCTFGQEVSWVQSIASCKGTDLVASGAGDGLVRLWATEDTESGGLQRLREFGGLATRGFVNGLHISRDGGLVVAAVGQEPRLGRWIRDQKAKNGLIVHKLCRSVDGD